MRSGHDLKDKPYYLVLLIAISLISHFPYVLTGFGEIDATKIAVSVIDMLNHGPRAAFANFYFTDVIPLYILYLKLSMNLLDHNYSYLPLVMNYTNAVFGTLTVVPAFLLIRQLFRNSTIAFCTVLALIFAPSFYQSTIMGFPHLIALFFFLVSLIFYLSGLDNQQKNKTYLSMALSCIFLTIAFLFKSDYVLATGAFIGLLFIRKIKDKWRISSSFLIILISGILFVLFRNMILGPSSGTTMSKEGLSKWYDYSLIIPTNFHYFLIQTKPIAYGAGIATLFVGTFCFLYYLFKKRLEIIIFLVSWAALPIVFWLVMIGNNARHNMITVLPLIAIIVIFFYEKASRYAIFLTIILILGNFFITSPSSSILTPSGRLFESHAMLEGRMIKFASSAKKIADIDDAKIAVLGYFHNPFVIFEIMRSSPSYQAIKIGREDYKIKTNDKEFVFLYFVVSKPEDMEYELILFNNKYNLTDYTFVSATYDLAPLRNRGYKTRTVNVIQRSDL